MAWLLDPELPAAGRLVFHPPAAWLPQLVSLPVSDLRQVWFPQPISFSFPPQVWYPPLAWHLWPVSSLRPAFPQVVSPQFQAWPQHLHRAGQLPLPLGPRRLVSQQPDQWLRGPPQAAWWQPSDHPQRASSPGCLRFRVLHQQRPRVANTK